MMGRIETIMKVEDLTTVDQLTGFLSGTHMMAISVFSNRANCSFGFRRGLVNFRPDVARALVTRTLFYCWKSVYSPSLLDISILLTGHSMENRGSFHLMPRA